MPRTKLQEQIIWMKPKDYIDKYNISKAQMSRIIHDEDFEEAIQPVGEDSVRINENLLNSLMRMKWRK